MLVAASTQVPLLMVGEFGLGGIPTAVGQFSPYRSPGHSERTRGAGSASKRERGGDCQRPSSASAFSRGAKLFVLQSINQGGGIQERSSPVRRAVARAERASRSSRPRRLTYVAVDKRFKDCECYAFALT